MATEIRAQGSLSAAKNGVSVSASVSVNPDMAGDQLIGNVQAIGTGAEAIVFGDISTIGYVFLKNMDATNYVDISMVSDATTPFAKLLAGDFTIIKAASALVYAKANTAGINLQVVAAEL
jgi:hypothetical protein